MEITMTKFKGISHYMMAKHMFAMYCWKMLEIGYSHAEEEFEERLAIPELLMLKSEQEYAMTRRTGAPFTLTRAERLQLHNVAKTMMERA